MKSVLLPRSRLLATPALAFNRRFCPTLGSFLRDFGLRAVRSKAQPRALGAFALACVALGAIISSRAVDALPPSISATTSIAAIATRNIATHCSPSNFCDFLTRGLKRVRTVRRPLSRYARSGLILIMREFYGRAAITRSPVPPC